MDLDNENNEIPIVNFKQPIDLNELKAGKDVTFEVNLSDFKNAEQEEEKRYGELAAGNLNLDCLGLQDEDEYLDGEPFAILAEKMTKLDKDGYIKKRILRKGVGDVVPESSVVYIDYNAYREYDEEPFDSTYIRNKQQRFCIGQGEVVVGLDVGVQTMRLNEKSQFLVAPEYAFGALGCLDRIPKNATILYEVVLAKIVDSGAAQSFDEIAVNEKKDFKDISKYCLALCEKAKELVTQRQLYKAAIREYNKVSVYLESCNLADYDEQMEQQKLLLRVYTNLAVCYMKVDLAKKCCNACNNAYKVCKGSNLAVPTKVYYNNAKALMILNDLKMAEARLRKAAEKNRDCPEIVRCYLELNRLQEQKDARDKLLATSLVAGSANFRQCVRKMCEGLKIDSTTMQYSLPKLTLDQQTIAEEEARSHQLFFEQSSLNNDIYHLKKATKPVNDS